MKVGTFNHDVGVYYLSRFYKELYLQICRPQVKSIGIHKVSAINEMLH